MFEPNLSLVDFLSQLEQSGGGPAPLADTSSLDLSAMLASDERYSAVDHGGYTVVYDHAGSDFSDSPYTIERIIFDNGFVL